MRIYARREHFVLQWWERESKRTLNERVDGDLVDAIARAREIDARLEHFKSSGQGVRKLKHGALIDLYVRDLHRRADAGELAVATVDRYTAALAHYRQFTDQPQTACRFAGGVDRDFQLAFAAYLERLQTAPNGHACAERRPFQSRQFVLDTARSMYEWAADADRGNLMPDGFRNPFQVRRCSRRRREPDQFGEPDITVEMAAEFLGTCDNYQLALFAPMILYGLRASEPTLIFREQIDQQWLKVVCLPELDYLTKGRRDKRFPLVAPVTMLLAPMLAASPKSLLYTRCGRANTDQRMPLLGMPLGALADEFQRRCAANRQQTAKRRLQIRDQIINEAGGLTYDHIEAEFGKLARQVKWPAQCTLKDFRHLFSTCLQNAGMPESYRRYLMGQAPGKAAIVTYSHLNELHPLFQEAMERKFQPILRAIERRANQLKLL